MRCALFLIHTSPFLSVLCRFFTMRRCKNGLQWFINSKCVDIHFSIFKSGTGCGSATLFHAIMLFVEISKKQNNGKMKTIFSLLTSRISTLTRFSFWNENLVKIMHVVWLFILHRSENWLKHMNQMQKTKQTFISILINHTIEVNHFENATGYTV